MRFLRPVIKIFLLLLWNTAVMIFVLPAQIFAISKWRRVRRGAFWAQIWARGCAFIAGVKVKVHGKVPSCRGKLLVSNHLGYLDILAHAVLFRLRFTPNDGIRRWFFVGPLVSLSAPVWIDRRAPRKAAEYAGEFRATMENGVSLLVYPEGTSSDGRHGLLPFKSTVFASLPEWGAIQPMLLFYREEPSGCGSAAWFDDTPFAVHVKRVLQMKRITVDVYMMPEMYALPGEDRKSLAGRVREAMMEEYVKYA